MGLDPQQTWRAEARRARRWLRRQWCVVEHLAGALLRRPPGRRTLSGAALSSLIDRARPGVSPPFVPDCYEAQARDLLARHRARWRGRTHWVVIEARKPRGTAVAWAEDPTDAQRIANDLAQLESRGELVVERRRAR